MVDGLVRAETPGTPAGTYEEEYLARAAVPTDVTIALTGKRECANSPHEITAEVCIETGGTGKTMRLYMVQVLDNYPASPEYYRNTLMQGADTEELTLVPGQCQTVVRQFIMNEISAGQLDDVGIIAWVQSDAQTYVPNANPDYGYYAAEIYQAAHITWPYPPTDVIMEWELVGDAGNDPDDTTYGSVGYEYFIGKYEVTNRQYINFLNSVAKTDPNGLYNTDMAGTYGGIDRIGSDGDYRFSAKGDDAAWLDRPVNWVSWYDAQRFANWMHNGQPEGAQDASTTEDGAYDMSLGDGAVRKPCATVFVPSEDEWYKAAYYKGGGTSAGYWDYPTQSDTAPTAEAPPGTDAANGSANTGLAMANVTDVGAYWFKPSDSAYGTFDQGGNLWEWNEAVFPASYRGNRGGSFVDVDLIYLSAAFRGDNNPVYESRSLGFRVAGLLDCDHNSVPDACDFACGSPGGACDCAGCGVFADCNSNGQIDYCESCAGLVTDCNFNGVPDACDLDDCDGSLWCQDCDTNSIPDNCQVDCDGNEIPDNCDIRDCDGSAWCLDCQPEGEPGYAIPDGCDIANCDGSEWCSDCQVNAIPDWCDIEFGPSNDCNFSDVPDECEAETPGPSPGDYYDTVSAPECTQPSDCDDIVVQMMVNDEMVDRTPWKGADCVAGYCYAPKNRFISFRPFATVPASWLAPCVAFEVTMTSSVEYPGSTGQVGWLSEAYDPSCQTGPGATPTGDCDGVDFVSRVVDTPYYTDDWPSRTAVQTLYVGDCEIGPAAVYEIRATGDGVIFSAPLEIPTIYRPDPHWYGDTAGVGTGALPPWPGYTPPDGICNVNDISAYLLTAYGATRPGVHWTWVDLHGLEPGAAPNGILGVPDLQRILFGCEGRTYDSASDQIDPATCP